MWNAESPYDGHSLGAFHAEMQLTDGDWQNCVVDVHLLAVQEWASEPHKLEFTELIYQERRTPTS